MICEPCKNAADLDEDIRTFIKLTIHMRCKGCDCQHRIPITNDEDKELIRTVFTNIYNS